MCPRRQTPPVSAVVDGLDRGRWTYGRGSTVAAVEEAVEAPILMTARALRTRLCETFARGVRVGLDRSGSEEGGWETYRGATRTCSRRACISSLPALNTGHDEPRFQRRKEIQAEWRSNPDALCCYHSITTSCSHDSSHVKSRKYAYKNQEYNHSNSLPPIAVSFHCVRNLFEARDVRTDDQARQGFARITFLQAELSASLKGRPEDVLHDALEPAVDLLKRPGEPGGILRHFETRDGDTAAVACLARSVPDGLLDTLGTSGLEDVDRLLGAALERRTRVGLYTVLWRDCADAPC